MNILEKLEQLMALVEASGEFDPEPSRDDSGEGSRARAWGRDTRTSDEKPDAPKPSQKDNLNRSGLAPASKYASALQNFGDKLQRTGAGGRTVVAAEKFSIINDMLKVLNQFIEEYGSLSISKKESHKGSYLDQYKASQAKKDAPRDTSRQLKIDKYATNSKDKALESFKKVIDPTTDPSEKKSRMNMLFVYIAGFNKARDVYKIDAIAGLKEKRIASYMDVADKKFFSKNPGQKFKGLTRNQFQAVITKIASKDAVAQFEKENPSWEDTQEFDDQLELIKSSFAVISMALARMSKEGAQYQYKAGAFGEPPEVLEIGSDRWQEYQHNKAAKKAGAKSSKTTPSQAAVNPTVRAGGKGGPASAAGGKPPKEKERPMSQEEMEQWLAAQDMEPDPVSDSVHRAWNRMLREAITIAAADRSPQWWDDI